MKSDLPYLVTAQKKIPLAKDWPVVEDSQALSWRSPLEIDDVTIAGLFMRVEADAFLVEEAVRVQLEFHPARGKAEPLCRVEWRPLRVHNNKGRGPQDLRFMPFRATHVHPFGLNWVSGEGRMLAGNLPIAIPIQDVDSFEKFLDICGKILNIENMQLVPVPPWRPRML